MLVIRKFLKESKVGRYIAYVYATKAVRDANPKDYITTINGSFEMDVKASAKNPVVQAYAAIKAEEKLSQISI